MNGVRSARRKRRPMVQITVLTALAVAAGMVVAAPVAALPDRRDPGPAAGPGGDAAVAMENARQHGVRVEVPSRRTQTGQLFANPDGTWTAMEAAVPQRVRRADGSWGPVDLTLRRAADGSVVPAAAPVPVRLSGGGSGAFASVDDAA